MTISTLTEAAYGRWTYRCLMGRTEAKPREWGCVEWELWREGHGFDDEGGRKTLAQSDQFEVGLLACVVGTGEKIDGASVGDGLNSDS